MSRVMNRAAVIGVLLVAACSSSKNTDVVCAGSSTVSPVMEIAGPAYEKLRPDVRVQVQGGGSSVGINMVFAS